MTSRPRTSGERFQTPKQKIKIRVGLIGTSEQITNFVNNISFKFVKIHDYPLIFTGYLIETENFAYIIKVTCMENLQKQFDLGNRASLDDLFAGESYCGEFSFAISNSYCIQERMSLVIRLSRNDAIRTDFLQSLKSTCMFIDYIDDEVIPDYILNNLVTILEKDPISSFKEKIHMLMLKQEYFRHQFFEALPNEIILHIAKLHLHIELKNEPLSLACLMGKLHTIEYLYQENSNKNKLDF